MKLKILIIALCLWLPVLASAQTPIKLNQAYLDLQAKIAKDPDNLNLKMDLAYLLTQGLEFNESLKIYREALVKDPQNLRATIELCVLLTDLREQQEAQKHCESATALKADDAVLWDNLGLHHFKFAQYDQALGAFFKARQLAPQSVLIQQHIAQTLLATGDHAGAQAYLEKRIAALPNASPQELSFIYYALHLAYKNQKIYGPSFDAIWKTYQLSGNGLFMGKVFTAFMAKHQFLSFVVIAGVALSFANFLGRRLNRFLKNED